MEIQKNHFEFQNFLLKYWDAIRLRITPCPQGSCTEARVQHVASERFSSTPHGWSPDNQCVRFTARFRLNGGSLQDPQTRQPVGTYACYINNCIAGIKEQHFDFSIFEHETVPVDGNSGTQHLCTLIDRDG